MKKNLFVLSSILTIGLLLAACGSTDTTDEETAPTPDDAAEEVVQEETDDSAPAADESEPEGTLTQSDGQNFEMHVLEGYELTAEEPKKDSLYVKDHPAVFMRIETFTLAETDFASAEETMIQTMEAVNPAEEPVEVPDFDGAGFTQSAAYKVPSTEGTVTGIVYEKEDLLVRLTIFDDSTINAAEDFIAMGKTITSKGQ